MPQVGTSMVPPTCSHTGRPGTLHNIRCQLMVYSNQHNEPAFIIRVPYYGTIYVLQTLALIRLAERDCGLLYGPLLIGATMRLGNLGNAVGKLYDGWDGFWEEAIERPRAAPDVRDYLGYRTYPRQVDLDSAPAYLGAPGSSTDGKGDQSLCVGAKYRSAYEHAFPIWSESYLQDAPKLIKEY